MLATTPARAAFAPVPPARPAADPARPAGLLLLAQFGIFAITLVALGRAINWPASLDEPAATILPLLVAQRGAVALGYASYLVSALLLLPIALLLRRVLGGPAGGLAAAGAVVGVVAGLCKALGILRWLTAMPVLAGVYVDSAGTPATRDAIAVVYRALNDYAGGIGELLGVSLFAGVWTILVGVAIARHGTGARPLPRWLGLFGIAAGIALLPGAAALLGRDLGPLYLTLSGVVWQLWMIAAGVALLRRPRA